MRWRLSHSVQVGLAFGLTSGIITTLGLLVGLSAGTESKLAVIGGVITIAVADSLSDALGIHISEESENVHSAREVWLSTGATFGAKFVVALTFLVPVLLFDLPRAVAVSIVWGGALLVLLSLRLAAAQGTAPWRIVAEHLAVATLVVGAAHGTGVWVARVFG